MTNIHLSKSNYFFVMVLFVCFVACDNGSDAGAPGSQDTASLSFTIHWEDEAASPASRTANTSNQANGSVHRAAVDCAGRNIASIEIVMYTGDNQLIVSSEWPCNAHKGTIDNIPSPQSDVTVILTAKNPAGEILYRGEKSALQISGGINEAGGITISRFIPPQPELADSPANTIQWKVVKGATLYHVEMSENEDFSNLVVDAWSETPAYSAVDIEPGIPHHVRIFARDARGNVSAGSEPVTFTSLESAQAPTNVTATGELLQVNLSWDSQAGTQYNIYWSTTPGVTQENHDDKFENIDGGTFVHNDCQGNTTYYYRVTALNSVGQESDLSIEASATAVGQPYAPDDVTTETGNRRVTLNWTAIPGFVYNVYWSTEPGVSTTNYQEKFENIDGGSIIHEDCAGTPHYYIVTAQNDLGESEPSAVLTATPGWLNLLGAHMDEFHAYHAVDASGNVYFVGAAKEFDEQQEIGLYDILLAKYDRDGNQLWAKLFGSPGVDYPYGLDMDDAGNVYITGMTNGDWDENQSNPGQLGFVLKTNADGEQTWVHFLHATEPDHIYHEPWGIAVDGEGNSYISGTLQKSRVDLPNTLDGFLVKYDAAGNQQWMDYLQTSGYDQNTAIALDSQGDVYITGRLGSKLGEIGSEMGSVFAAKYSPDGQRSWITALEGFPMEFGWAIAANQEYCYISARMAEERSLLQLKADDGAVQWQQRLAANENSSSFPGDPSEPFYSHYEIAVAPNGNVILGGHTVRAYFYGLKNTAPSDENGYYTTNGSMDLVLMAYDSTGQRLWCELYGSTESEGVNWISVHNDGYVYISGDTLGDLAGQTNAGHADIYIWKRNIFP